MCGRFTLTQRDGRSLAAERGYLTGLVLPGARQSVEPMAALLAPARVRQTHQSLHHLVADAPWADEAVLQAVREYALVAIAKRGPIQAWIVDDTGMPKKGGMRWGWRVNIVGNWASATTARWR
jgi:SRSO17 transposase